MTNYANGAAMERLAKAELESQGYKVVRSAGSHSLVDLVAWDAYGFRLIQIKKSKHKRSFGKEVRQLKTLPVPEGTAKELWVRHKAMWHKTTL